MEVKKITYHLAAMHLTDDNMAYAAQERFYRISPKYILIYAQEVPEGALVITEDDYNALTDSEKLWLNDCNIVIMVEFEKEHAEAVEKGRMNFFQELESNLEEEARKVNVAET